MTGNRCMISVLTCALMALTVVLAQDFDDGMPEEPKPEPRKSTLLPRPDDDPRTAAWVRASVVTRPRVINTEPGVHLRHVISPDGERFYFLRELPPETGPQTGPGGRRYALYTVGPGKAQSKVADTGAECSQPIFLGDGRILFMTRRADTNEDDVIDELDDATLMVSNRDGGNQRVVVTLRAGETPLAVWRDDREVLINVAADDDVNGSIVSLNLVRGDRTHVVNAFNVELVLPDGRLLIERLQPALPVRNQGMGWNRWGEPEPEPEPTEPAKPTLVDHTEHVLFDPKDGTETLLYSPNRRSSIALIADNTFFGSQEPELDDGGDNWNPWGMDGALARKSELLIVDDAQHFDVRSPSSKFSYAAIGQIPEHGALVIESGNLGSRLLLVDRALKTHRLADFDLHGRGFVTSADGRTIAWLEVEDTDENGRLEPWKDRSRIMFIKIE